MRRLHSEGVTVSLTDVTPGVHSRSVNAACHQTDGGGPHSIKRCLVFVLTVSLKFSPAVAYCLNRALLWIWPGFRGA